MKRGIAQLLFTFDEDTFQITVLREEMDDLDKVSTRHPAGRMDGVECSNSSLQSSAISAWA